MPNEVYKQIKGVIADFCIHKICVKKSLIDNNIIRNSRKYTMAILSLWAVAPTELTTN